MSASNSVWLVIVGLAVIVYIAWDGIRDYKDERKTEK